MSCNVRIVAACLACLICSTLQAAPVSVTFESYTPGTISPGTLDTAAYKATPDAKFQDFPRNTGGGTNKFARGLSNNSFAASTILPIGKGGGLTLKFQEPLFPQAGTKEFAIHNGTFSSASGGFFYGDMEGAILVSDDNVEWRTLSGSIVANPLTYTGTIHDMNAPTMSYVWGTGKIAWDYCTGSGRPQSVLDTFALADYGFPMPDDSLFNNPVSTNAERDALQTSTDTTLYDNIFGASAGGNWFDISNTGLTRVNYLRINVDMNAPSTMRFDSVFANPAALVPEPAALLLVTIGVGGLLLRRLPRNLAAVVLVVAISPLTATATPYSTFNFSDIDYWVGTGSNQAALVVDFRLPSGETSFAWGYKWDGIATGEEMFRAIAGTTVLYQRDSDPLIDTFSGSDARLYLRASAFGGLLGNSVFGIGYDIDGDGGSFVSGSESDETGYATDSNDAYREGWFTGYWSYWISEPTEPEWGYSGLGFSSRQLIDGSWDGWSFADFNAGDFGTPPALPVPAQVPEPASLMLVGMAAMVLVTRRRRKEVPALLVVGVIGLASSQAVANNPYAMEIINQNDAFGTQSLYNDPNAVLGEPTSLAVNSPFPPVANVQFHTKMVEPAYNRDSQGNKVITTLSRRNDGGSYTYGSITVKFDHQVYDDPVNPYGIDLNVFGNAFYVGGGTEGAYVSDETDMRSYYLAGGIFAEPVVISVSPDNFNWYTYSEGPYGDTAFPTQGYAWDAEQHDLTGSGWTDQKMDFTKPVNPTLDAILGAAGPTISVADALQMYDRSGGGTGIDLARSGFEWIQYVRVQSTAEFRDGEIDAFADVRPMQVGDSLSMTPANITDGTLLYFQNPTDLPQTAIRAEFTDIADSGKLATSAVTDETALAALSHNVLANYQLEVGSLVDNEPLSYTANFQLLPGDNYIGDGSDLSVLSWIEDSWQAVAFSFDTTAARVVLKDWSQSLSLLAIIQNAGLSGDFDGDGNVNGRDFLAWQRNPEIGNLADWQTNFEQPNSPLTSTTAVPEPGASALLLASLLVFTSHRPVKNY